MVICCMFKKKISSTSEFIYIFSWFNKCIQPHVRGRQPQGTNFWCQQKPLVTSVICYKFKKKSLWSLILYTFFHNFIHVYSPAAGADNPLGTKFWCQQEHLVTSVICCMFQKHLFEVWFYIIFSWFKMYIAPGQGQTAPGKQSFDVNRNVLLLHSFVPSFKKCLWSLILYNFFMI